MEIEREEKRKTHFFPQDHPGRKRLAKTKSEKSDHADFPRGIKVRLPAHVLASVPFPELLAGACAYECSSLAR
jgi:hypothetical protein